MSVVINFLTAFSYMSVDCVGNDDKQEKMRGQRGMLLQSRP